MAVDFTRKDPPWVDVPDPTNPPAGASKIMASDLNRIEDAVESLAAESGAIEVDTSVGTRVTVGGHIVHYDSGWRDISGDIEEGWALGEAGLFLLRRIGDRVYLYIRNLIPGEDAPTYFYQSIPNGFRSDHINQRIPVASESGVVQFLVRRTSRDIRGHDTTTTIGSRWDGVSVEWITSDSWIPALPGTPA